MACKPTKVPGLSKMLAKALCLVALSVSMAACVRSTCRSELYLGHVPPGATPELFGPGVISTDHHEFSLSVSPFADEVMFTRRPKGTNENRILVSRLENGRWSAPVLAPFAVDTRESEPNYSPDGNRVYFNSRRQLSPTVQPADAFNVWVATRSDGGWADPKVIGAPVSAIRPMFVTESNNGTIYMTGTRQRGIYKAAKPAIL